MWVWACVCLKVWPLFATVGLKRSGSNQSTAANIRGKLKSRNSDTHAQAGRQGGLDATEAEWAKRGERLRLRHRAETGIKESGSRERERGSKKSSQITCYFLFTCVRHPDTVPIIVPLRTPSSSTSVSEFCTMATGVFRAVREDQKNKQSEQSLYHSHLLSYAQTHLCTVCSASASRQQEHVQAWQSLAYVISKVVCAQTCIFLCIKTNDAH